MSQKGVEFSARCENYYRQGILRTFYVDFSLLTYSDTELKKSLEFLLRMKTLSSGEYYVAFKSVSFL